MTRSSLVYIAGVLAIVIVAAWPQLDMWVRMSARNGAERSRGKLEAVLRMEIDLFCLRHGHSSLREPNVLFQRYGKVFVERIKLVNRSIDTLDQAELLTLYAVGLVFRDEAGRFVVQPLFDDSQLDKTIPILPGNTFHDYDADGWYEIGVPGMPNTVYELN